MQIKYLLLWTGICKLRTIIRYEKKSQRFDAASMHVQSNNRIQSVRFISAQWKRLQDAAFISVS